MRKYSQQEKEKVNVAFSHLKKVIFILQHVVDYNYHIIMTLKTKHFVHSPWPCWWFTSLGWITTLF